MSRIVSGGLMLEAAAVRLSTAGGLELPVTEPWTVNDSPGALNGTYSWVQFVGGTGWGVRLQGAELTGQAANTQAARLNASLGTNDYAVTVTYDAWAPAGSGVLAGGPAVRCQPDGAFTYYTAALANLGGPTQLYLFAFVAGQQFTLGGPVTVQPHAGMTVTLRASGPGLTASFDGTALLTAPNDTRIPTGMYAGIQGVASGGNLVRFSTWTANSLLTAYTLAANTGALTLGSGPRPLLVDRRLAAASGARTLTGQAAAFQTLSARTFLAARGLFGLTGAAATFSVAGAKRLTAATGHLTLTGGASDRHLAGNLVNVLTGNPWVIATPSVVPLTRARTRVVAVRWIGADFADRVVITDAGGHRIWSSVADTFHHTEYDYLDGRLYTGVTVPTLDSGTLEIEVA